MPGTKTTYDVRFLASIKTLLLKLCFVDDWYKIPPADMQKHFDSWDYISSHTLRAELGIANELDASNIPYKVLQLTGEDAKRQIKSNGHNSGRPL